MNQKLIEGGHTSHLPLHTSNRGITLIALVITIIVLLILAGVTINMVLGEDGIIQNAQKAKNLNKDGQIEEALDLLRAEVKMAEHGLETTLTLPLDAEGVINELLKDDIVEPNVLEKKGTKTIGYTDETKTKTFSLEGIVKWDNSQEDLFTISDDGTITSYTGEGVTNVIIPEEIDGVKVTGIGEEVFAYSDITSIEIPDGVTSIGLKAFYGCSSLTNIEIPNSVTSISAAAFADCTSLVSITIPEGVTSLGKDAPGDDTEVWGVFDSCSSLSKVELPTSLTVIGSLTFANCPALVTIDIPTSVIEIGYGAFCRSGLTSVIIPDSVTSIDYSVFDSCRNLASVVLPKGLTEITCGLFWESGLSYIEIPDGVSAIWDEAFKGCENLTEITIPSSVTKIATKAFYGCVSLKMIRIEGTITKLWEDVFKEVHKDCEIKYQGEWYSPAEFETLING